MCRTDSQLYSICAHLKLQVIYTCGWASRLCGYCRKPQRNMAILVGWCPDCVAYYTDSRLTGTHRAKKDLENMTVLAEYWAFKAARNMTFAVKPYNIPIEELDSFAYASLEPKRTTVEERSLVRQIAAVGPTTLELRTFAFWNVKKPTKAQVSKLAHEARFATVAWTMGANLNLSLTGGKQRAGDISELIARSP
ncbi:hypothetical protein G7046_g6228 [Stylonectria norvegica]|nr:hypothetical protein G7046_g6228 [Stylonectria norvegica]